MLSTLKGELVKKGLNPTKAIMEATGCSENTARNKLTERTPLTYPEAETIRNTYFPDLDFPYLFASDRQASA